MQQTEPREKKIDVTQAWKHSYKKYNQHKAPHSRRY